MQPDEILTPKQVAEFLKLSPLTVHRLTKRGVLPGVKLGGQWRYWRGNIEKIMRNPELLNSRDIQDEDRKIA